jgi:hypothetical protein
MAEVRSTIVCPACGHRESEIIPEDACQYFYKCKGCRVVLKPKKGDCCVCARLHSGIRRGGEKLVPALVHGLWFEISALPMARLFCFL